MSNVKTFWLPHSVDTSLFKPRGERTIDILHTGTVNKNYPLRQVIIAKLFNDPRAKIIPRPRELAPFQPRPWPCGEDYAKLLSSAKIHPTCTSIYGYVLAKHFEIAASGTLLMTDWCNDLSFLGFEHGKNYVKIVKGNVKDKINYFLKNDKEREEITANAVAMIYANHNVQKRAEQLYNIFKEITNLSQPKVLFLTVDRSNRIAQLFTPLQTALHNTYKCDIDTRHTSYTFLRQYADDFLAGKVSPEPINISSDYDLVYTDAPFMFLHKEWSKIGQTKGILLEDLHGTIPKEMLRRASKLGVDFITYRYQTSYQQHPSRL
jgi:hypothetical protein